jgi:hypothetical protein
VSSGILVFDGLEEFGYVQKNDFEKVALDLVGIMLEKYGVQVCYLKFHPLQENERMKYFELLIKRSFPYADFQILGNEISLELLAIKNPNIQFFGFISSALLYAKLIANCKSYSVINRLSTKKVLVSDFFKQNVTLIDYHDTSNPPI